MRYSLTHPHMCSEAFMDAIKGGGFKASATSAQYEENKYNWNNCSCWASGSGRLSLLTPDAEIDNGTRLQNVCLRCIISSEILGWRVPYKCNPLLLLLTPQSFYFSNTDRNKTITTSCLCALGGWNISETTSHDISLSLASIFAILFSIYPQK